MLCRAHSGACWLSALGLTVSALCSCPVIGCLVNHMPVNTSVPGLSPPYGLPAATDSYWQCLVPPPPSGVYKGPLVIFSIFL